MSSAHSLLSPSSAHRWTVCYGSINLCKLCPPAKTSPYALEGLAAHALAEKCLSQNIEPMSFLGQFQIVKDDEGKIHTFEVDDEMVEAIEIYVNFIQVLINDDIMPDHHIMYEKKVDVSFIHKDIRGTADAIIYNAEEKTLNVFDLKYGKGVVVEPEWNEQLMIYGLGALQAMWFVQTQALKQSLTVYQIVDKVVLNIVQPRAYHLDGPVRTWEISSYDLMYWGTHVLSLAAKETEKEGAMLNAGSHCKFCSALAVCPEQTKKAMALAKTDFDNPVLPSPEYLTPEHIAKVMDTASVMSSWVDSIKAYAQSQMETGIKIPGYKMVQKRSFRKWKSEAKERLIEVLGDEAYEYKLIGIPKAEKIIKKMGESPEALLHDLFEKPEAGLIIAPEKDKRKEVTLSPAELDFTEEDDFLC